MRQASASFARIRTVLLSKRYLSVAWRIRLWRAVIFSSLEHGLYCAGLTKHRAIRLRTFALRQIRAIASSPVYITRETRQQVLSNLGLEDPFHYILKAADKAYGRLTACCSTSVPTFMTSIQDSARDVLSPASHVGFNRASYLPTMRSSLWQYGGSHFAHEASARQARLLQRHDGGQAGLACPAFSEWLASLWALP